MENISIVFGTIKKAGRDNTSYEKYTDKAVVTLEGVKGENKSRRLLFNGQASDKLNLLVGFQQSVIFGFLQADANGDRKILIANADTLPNKDATVVYTVSKNRVAFDDSKEKGKAISSSNLIKELNSFIEVDENISHEYELEYFGENSGLDLYELKKIRTESDNRTSSDYVNNPLSFKGQEHLLDELKGSDFDIELEDNLSQEEADDMPVENVEYFEEEEVLEVVEREEESELY